MQANQRAKSNQGNERFPFRMFDYVPTGNETGKKWHEGQEISVQNSAAEEMRDPRSRSRRCYFLNRYF
jgi:hypothetical protein